MCGLPSRLFSAAWTTSVLLCSRAVFIALSSGSMELGFPFLVLRGAFWRVIDPDQKNWTSRPDLVGAHFEGACHSRRRLGALYTAAGDARDNAPPAAVAAAAVVQLGRTLARPAGALPDGRHGVEQRLEALTVVHVRSFHSVVNLQAAIHRYIAEHNADPKPSTWTKTPGQIIAKLNPPNAPVH
jgi:hypothetical protein